MTTQEQSISLLEVKNLDVSFKTEGGVVPILNRISFSLQEQQTLGIVGESGSGKSVTAMSILRLIGRPPLHEMSGKIRYNHTDLLSCSGKQMQKVRGKEIGFIFQEPMTALNPVFTVGDQIEEMIRTHKEVSKKEARIKGIGLLTEVGIPSPKQRMKNYPHELSGGMRQRAMIAMALSCSPKILIADEPTTALDVTVQAQILELFKKLKEEHRMSIIFITHDLGVIAEIADQVLIMHNGTVIESNTVEEIFHYPAHPYTRKLLSLLPGRKKSGNS